MSCSARMRMRRGAIVDVASILSAVGSAYSLSLPMKNYSRSRRANTWRMVTSRTMSVTPGWKYILYRTLLSCGVVPRLRRGPSHRSVCGMTTSADACWSRCSWCAGPSMRRAGPVSTVSHAGRQLVATAGGLTGVADRVTIRIDLVTTRGPVGAVMTQRPGSRSSSTLWHLRSIF